MELICISTFSVTRKGVRTVYPAYPERIVCLRLNGRIISDNLFDIHRTGAHITELSSYDAMGTVLTAIEDTEQYKKILEKLYIRVLIYGATFDHQPRHGCDYDSTLILTTSAPENVIVLAMSKILASMSGASLNANSLGGGNNSIGGGIDVDNMSVAGQSTISTLYDANAHMSQHILPPVISALSESQMQIENTLSSIKESLYNINTVLQSMDSRLYNVEDRCDAMDGHIGALDEYNKPIKPPSFCGQSDTDSSIASVPIVNAYSSRYAGTHSSYVPQTNLQYSGAQSYAAQSRIAQVMQTVSSRSAGGGDNMLLDTRSSTMTSVSSAYTLHTGDDIAASLSNTAPVELPVVVVAPVELPSVVVEELPVVVVEELPVVVVEELPVVVEDLPVVVDELPVVVAEELPVVAVEELPVVVAEELPVVVAEDLLVVVVEDLPVVVAEELPVVVVE
jgi:hypothetical protein